MGGDNRGPHNCQVFTNKGRFSPFSSNQRFSANSTLVHAYIRRSDSDIPHIGSGPQTHFL